MAIDGPPMVHPWGYIGGPDRPIDDPSMAEKLTCLKNLNSAKFQLRVLMAVSCNIIPVWVSGFKGFLNDPGSVKDAFWHQKL